MRSAILSIGRIEYLYSIFFANSYITFVRACMCVCFIIIYVLLYFFAGGGVEGYGITATIK